MPTIDDSIDILDYAVAQLKFFCLTFENETFINATSEAECLGAALTLDGIVERLR